MKKIYRKVLHKHIPIFKDVKDEDWNDWKWQLNNTIKDISSLSKIITIDEKEKEQLAISLKKFKMAITPYYAALIDENYIRCPIRLQAVPRIQELIKDDSDISDPLHEDIDSPVPGLTHRYPDRVLLLVTRKCSMYCRHCTRRRVVGCDESGFNKECFLDAVNYIKKNKQIRDVIVSGGDPLTLPDSRIEYILETLRNINHVEIIRIGSRTPVVMPQRITDNLVNIIKKYQPIFFNTHFNHPDEITEEAKIACDKLTENGVPVGNQTVLLRDVNDCPFIMKELMHELLKIRVKPYYIYQCDLSTGISHFRTSVGKGIEIIENLRGHTSGMAVPTYVVDAPGGGGKIPVMPNYVISRSDKKLILRNYEGTITVYTQPSDTSSDCGRCNICKNTYKFFTPSEGVATLLEENIQNLNRR
ncbi:MAG: lysine 2,3-aminomutase [Victivallales bacterium]|nr:lysine 2,3-aminomutase [Victivallales bacterium]MCF7889077.1 lysine 2,3-aminomutase [Victivallales bacterium]